LVNDPEKAVEWLGSDEDTSIFTAEELAELAYTTSLMNDVHMSHAMEFPYPQSMANCIVCHEDKLDMILTDEHLTLETCKSCHAMTGSEEYGTTELALETIIPATIHGSMDWETVDCGSCHDFDDIHVGYDTMIYASEGLRYSDAIVVTIDDASMASNKLTIKFSAESGLAEYDVEDIVPTVLVGMYGWDTKDYIQGPHERSFDTNADGVVDRSDGRDLEYDVGEEHDRFTTVSATGGSWEVTADLSAFASLITDDTVQRLEIAVIPALEDADGELISLNAPSRTFDLATNDFDDDYYNPIVKLEGCENCHDALATNFHSPDYGGNIVVCRLCHITKSGGSHLEMQSRSIDSYVHAIHSMQPFDMDDKDFSDEVEELHYEHHINFPYPTHGITNCESCHYEGTYNVPDQTKSLGGLLSESHYPLEGWDRDIKEIPEYVTGPAARACGACHRAVLINEDAASELISLYQHMKTGGYLIEAGDDDVVTLLRVIDEIMANFE
jgi:OmcA/MtrC family decaheme c-type cytochrome